MSNALSLLGKPNTLRILRLVWTEERSAGEIAGNFRITFGAVSQHLGALWRGGFLRRRREGKRIFYLADREALGPLAGALEAMWTDRLTTLKAMAEGDQRRIDLERKRRRARNSSRRERP